jgi:hypothetical protein
MTSRRKQKNVRTACRQAILSVERLEDRITPVIGNGAAPPAPIAAGGLLAGGVAGELDHVVHTRTANGLNGSGALLSTQRHILAVAHTIDGTQTTINFHMMRNRGGAAVQVPITFTLPADAAMNRWQVREPGYVPVGGGALQATNDIGIFRLTDQANPAADRYVIAPVGLNNLRGYAISGVNPVGQVATFVGYGFTGIGNWGNSAEAVQNLDLNNIPAGAGNFTLSFTPPGGGAAQVTGNINAVGLTAAGLAAALEALPALAPIPGAGGAPPTRQVEVIRWNANQFSVRFIGPNVGGRAIALMVANVAPGQGAFAVVPSVVWGGGFTPAKRTGDQTIEQVLGLAGVPAAVAANYVEADFDNGVAAQNSLGGLGLPNEGMIGPADSGGPAFRRNAANALEIIGINQGFYRTASPPDLNNWVFSNGNAGPADSSFGEFSVFTAARNFNNAGGFIDTITNNQPYDLILDMSRQVIGADLAGENVTINVRRIAGDVVIEVTDPLGAYSGVYFRDAANRIRSLEIRGTNDNETVNLPNNLLGPGRRVRFIGGGGNDTTNIARLDAGNGGDLIAFNGGDGDDTLNIEDQVGSAGLAYLVAASSVSAADLNIDEYDGTEHLMVLAAGLNDTVDVSGLSTQTTMLNGGGGDDTITLATSSTVTGLTVEGADSYDLLVVASGYVPNPTLLNLEAITITGGTLQLDNDLTILDYDQSGGTFTGTAHLTASSSLGWSGGTMSGSGVTTLAMGGALTLDGGTKTLLSRTLENGGTGLWSSGDILGGTGTVHNLAGASLSGVGLLEGALINDGTLDLASAGAIGTISVNGDFTQSGSGTLHIDLVTPGTGSDRLTVSETVALGGALSLTPLSGFSGDSFTLINNTGPFTVIGIFSGLPEGSAVFLNGSEYRISYQGGDGNDVVLNRTGSGGSGGSLGDFVWNDADNDGIQDAGEAGVFGVTVNLLDSLGNWLASTTTDGTGHYQFAGRPAGNYKLQFVAPTGYQFSPQDQGTDDALDSDADASGLTVVYSLADGQQRTDIDAGLYYTGSGGSGGSGGSIGDRVWYDADNDGVQDAGESGASGVTVRLLDGSGQLLQTTTTDGAGQYHFFGLAAGNYRVQFVAPFGYQFSPQGQGGDTALDSDADASGLTAIFSLSLNESRTNVDAGLTYTGSGGSGGSGGSLAPLSATGDSGSSEGAAGDSLLAAQDAGDGDSGGPGLLDLDALFALLADEEDSDAGPLQVL